MSSLHDSIRGALKWNEVESALNVHCHWTFSGESPPPSPKKREKKKKKLLTTICFQFVVCKPTLNLLFVGNILNKIDPGGKNLNYNDVLLVTCFYTQF